MTTVHRHGLRVPMDPDDVPYLTRSPIGVGETHSYRFTPQDAGTYWFHPHCNTLEPISRGMAGLLVVDEAEDPGFAADTPLLIHAFRLDHAGTFLPLSAARSAARGGTLGSAHTANRQVNGTTPAPAGSLVRLRLAAADVTRTYALSVTSAAAMVIAQDGHPLPTPLPGGEVRLTPGQRADLALVTPSTGEVTLQLTLSGGKTHTLHRSLAPVPGRRARPCHRRSHRLHPRLAPRGRAGCRRPLRRHALCLLVDQPPGLAQ